LIERIGRFEALNDGANFRIFWAAGKHWMGQAGKVRQLTASRVRKSLW
jgi:hypothetical protein